MGRIVVTNESAKITHAASINMEKSTKFSEVCFSAIPVIIMNWKPLRRIVWQLLAGIIES
jgi:hypothetical protein